jgi:apolipoprotein N-acyltransferase
VDFHLIASNEAWYRRSVEMDHMLAFSRMIAAATGRSVLRATNSGISALIGPDGSLLEVLEGPDGPKMARGVGTWTVPVPVRDGAGRAPRTVFVLTERAQLLGWLLAIALLALLSRSAVTVEASGVEPPTGP